MNLHDKAHDLARILKASDEFKEYENWHKIVMENPTKAEMINDYRKKFIDFQIANAGETELDDEKVKQLEELQKTLLMDGEISSFLVAENRFATLYNDIIEILTEAIGLDGK